MTAFRRDAHLAAGYGKDPADESFLRALNDYMVDFEERRYQALEERWPVVHVFGVPRSGTTLAVQLLAAHLDVGYIDHIVAAFWRAPVTGIRLSRKLLGEKRNLSYDSTFGRTAAVHEPHEFGYFWAQLLGYDDLLEPTAEQVAAVDWQRLRRVLINMTHAFGRPLVLKTFFAGWHIRELARVMPTSCFVYVRRDPVDTARSILKTRAEYGGSRSERVGIQPREYRWLKDEAPEVQVAGQVHFLTRSFERGIEAIGGRNLIVVRYEDMCREPHVFVERVADALVESGCVVERSGRPLPFPVRTAEVQDSAVELVRQALKRFASSEDTEP